MHAVKTGKIAMKETIVTVAMPSRAAKIPRETWWSDVEKAASASSKWRPIAANNVFAIASRVGTFIVSNKSFASGMMCGLSTWEKRYRSELETILKEISPDIDIAEEETDVSGL